MRLVFHAGAGGGDGGAVTSGTGSSSGGGAGGLVVGGGSLGTAFEAAPAVVLVTLSEDSGGGLEPPRLCGCEGGLRVGSLAVLHTLGCEAVSQGGLGLGVVVDVVAATSRNVSSEFF